MANPNFFILYVDSPMASAAFYADLLGRPPVQSVPTLALFALDWGVMLGLVSNWTTRGLEILQKPVLLGFGYTFVALDPDQQRLRVFSPGAPQ